MRDRRLAFGTTLDWQIVLRPCALRPRCRTHTWPQLSPLVLYLKGKAGLIHGDLPPYEAFPIGGTNSVRGYTGAWVMCAWVVGAIPVEPVVRTRARLHGCVSGHDVDANQTYV